MRISVNEVKNLNSRLKTSISSYESKYMQYYNYLNQTENDWYDEKAKMYFQTIEEDKINDYNTLQEMKSIHNIYSFLVKSYEEIGNKIYYNPEQKERINILLDDIIEECNNIINAYNNIGIYNYSERSMLFNQKNEFMKMLEKAKKCKSTINTKISKIEKIEKSSLEKFKALEVSPIRKKDITPYR